MYVVYCFRFVDIHTIEYYFRNHTHMKDHEFTTLCRFLTYFAPLFYVDALFFSSAKNTITLTTPLPFLIRNIFNQVAVGELPVTIKSQRLFRRPVLLIVPPPQGQIFGMSIALQDLDMSRITSICNNTIKTIAIFDSLEKRRVKWTLEKEGIAI